MRKTAVCLVVVAVACLVGWQFAGERLSAQAEQGGVAASPDPGEECRAGTVDLAAMSSEELAEWAAKRGGVIREVSNCGHGAPNCPSEQTCGSVGECSQGACNAPYDYGTGGCCLPNKTLFSCGQLGQSVHHQICKCQDAHPNDPPYCHIASIDLYCE